MLQAQIFSSFKFSISFLETIQKDLFKQSLCRFILLNYSLVNFFRFYLKAVNADAAMEKRVRCLALLALSARDQLCYWPSTVAAALVILASLELNQNASHKVIGVITIAIQN